MVEAPAALEPGQNSGSCIRVRVPSDVEPYLHEAPKAGVQTGSCVKFRPLANQSWPSLQHSRRHYGVLNVLENSMMQGERVLRMGHEDLGDQAHLA